MRYLLLLGLAWVFTLSSCVKGDDASNISSELQTGKGVEIYLLDIAQLVQDKCQIDPASSTLLQTPLASNDEILDYSKGTYTFTLAVNAYNRVKQLKDKTPFAVTINKEVIYYAFFKPGVSSSSCVHSITMDVVTGQASKIRMQLGYPGPMQGVPINDQRNDTRLLDALQLQGKLSN